MTDDDGTQEMAKQSAIVLLGTVAERGLGFLFVALVTRLVSPSVYGVYTLALSLVLLLRSFSDLNVQRSIDYFLPDQLHRGNYEAAKTVVSDTLTIIIGSSLLATGGLLLFASQIGDFFSEPLLPLFLLSLAILLLLKSISNVFFLLFSGTKEFTYRVLTQNVLFPASKIILVISLLFVVEEQWGLILGHVGAVAITAIVAVGIAVTRYQWLWKVPRAGSHKKRILKYSVPLAFSGVLFATVAQIDFFFIGFFMQSSDIAVYKIAYVLGSNILVVVVAIGIVVKPSIAEIQEGRDALATRFRVSTRWCLLLSAPVSLTLFLAPAIFVEVLFTQQYLAAAAPVAVLAFGYMIHSALGPSRYVLEARGHSKLVLLNTMVLLLINAGLNFALVPRIGIVGAAISTAVAYASYSVLGVIEVYYIDHTHPFDGVYTKGVLALSGASVVGFVLVSVVQHDIVLFFVLPMAILASTVLGLVTVSGFIDSDLEIAKQIDKRIGVVIVTSIVSLGLSQTE